MTTPAPAGGLVPARPVAAQAHALRAAAALVERAGIAGLSLTIGQDILIQVPERLASPAARAAAVAWLAAATSGTATRDDRPGSHTRGWVLADGQFAGHPVRIFTAIEDTP